MKFASKSIYPGWRMTVAQHGLYFRLFGAACEAQGAATSAAKEALRQAAHRAAFGGPKSAKDINSKQEFDAIKREFQRVASVLDVEDQAGKRMLFVVAGRLQALSETASPNYVATLLKERFKSIQGVRTIEDLTPKQLTDLLSTVNNRIRLLGGTVKAQAADNIPF